MIRRFVILLSLVASALAQPPPPRLTAPTITGDRIEGSLESQTGVAVLRGNAEFRDAGMLLQADEIQVEWAPIESAPGSYAAKATARGHVVFTRADSRLLAERLVYYQADGSFAAEHIRLGSYPYFAEGEAASGTRTEITLTRARASYGEPAPPEMGSACYLLANGSSYRPSNYSANR